MRDRLIKLLDKADEKVFEHIRENDTMDYVPTRETILGIEADHLLANGVVILPFPIGTPYYRIVTKRQKVGGEYFKIIRRAELNWYNLESVLNDFGKTVFLTREEAERTMNEVT